MPLSPASSHGSGYPLGLAGATGATRYVGGTASGAPASGTFLAGDFVVDLTGAVYVCTVAGSPGTWVAVGGGATIGRTQLVYRYTVAGVDKASIDTGVDAAQAGDNVWTGGDVLEVFLMGRTDDAAVQATVVVTFNNDATAIYDRQHVQGANATAGAGTSVAQTGWSVGLRGDGGLAGQSGTTIFRFPNYLGTTFNKSGDVVVSDPDSTGANEAVLIHALAYRSTAALSRLKIAGTAAAKLRIGTQLLIYKRLSA